MEIELGYRGSEFLSCYYRSCQIFQQFSNSLAHIVQFKTGQELDWYLDDYFFVHLLKTNCDWQITVFLGICKEINFPVSEDKTVWGQQEIVFLGLLLNTILQIVSIPEDKRQKAQDALDRVLRAKKVKVLDLQKLTGQLNFLSQAIVPGRTFTRRMYAKYRTLKQHHHVRVDGELRADCDLWMKFLQQPVNVSRPFLDFLLDKTAEALILASDASLNVGLGIGGHFTRNMNGKLVTSWFSQKWPRNFIRQSDCSIEVAELYGACMAVTIWIKELANRRVVIWCDNQAVVQMINKASSSCGKCMFLLRHLTLLCMTNSCRIFCRYVSTKQNWRADLLSRMKVQAFKERMAGSKNGVVEEHQMALCGSLWPPPPPLWHSQP